MAPSKADGDFAKDPPPLKSWDDFATFIKKVRELVTTDACKFTNMHIRTLDRSSIEW